MRETLESHLTNAQRDLFCGLTTPVEIQAYLDSTAYRPEYSNFCPLQVLETRRAHCLDGAIFGAAALRHLGYPALLVDMFPDAGMDDDHVLAIFNRRGCWGAVAKSNFVGLRYREPAYRSLRELVMSYFESFFNVNGARTLRSYTRPLDLALFDRVHWEFTEAGTDAIEKALLKRARIPLIPPEIAADLSPVDSISYQAGMAIANPDGLYRPKA